MRVTTSVNYHRYTGELNSRAGFATAVSVNRVTTNEFLCTYQGYTKEKRCFWQKNGSGKRA